MKILDLVYIEPKQKVKKVFFPGSEAVNFSVLRRSFGRMKSTNKN